MLPLLSQLETAFSQFFEVPSLLWNYHGVTGRVFQLSAAFVRTPSPSEEEIKDTTKKFTEASDALYSGLYSCRSKIHQYFNEYTDVDLALDELRDWNFHGSDCSDNYYLFLLHALSDKNEPRVTEVMKKLKDEKSTALFRSKVDKILKPLAQELREINTFSYPFKQYFRKRTGSNAIARKLS